MSSRRQHFKSSPQQYGRSSSLLGLVNQFNILLEFGLQNLKQVLTETYSIYSEKDK